MNHHKLFFTLMLSLFVSIVMYTKTNAQWTSQTSGTTNDLFGVFFTDANTGTAVGQSGTILRTTDGGTIWAPQTSGTTEFIKGIFFTDANTGTIGANQGTILRTTDGGTTWTPQTSGTTQFLRSVSFIDANTATVVGNTGTILRMSNATGIEDNTVKIPTNFDLMQNYPNPFNPSTSIQFSLPQTSYVTLEVFNTLGERVEVLASEELTAGTYNYRWDASDLTSGIYFYKLQAGSFTQTKKMILLK